MSLIFTNHFFSSELLIATNSEDIAMEVWTIFIKRKTFNWKKLSSSAVLVVQELLVACLPHLPLQYKLDMVSKIILMTEIHIPSKKLVLDLASDSCMFFKILAIYFQDKSWEDHCMALLKCVTKALQNVKSCLCTGDMITFEMVLCKSRCTNTECCLVNH